MLQEVPNIRQVPGEDRRRWFASDDMDLTVWFGDRGGITGFELGYGKGEQSYAVRWGQETGFLQGRVDDGEGRPGRFKGSPVLLPDRFFDAKQLSRLFRENSRDLDGHLTDFICQKLLLVSSSSR
jgi:hypothetical protein